MSQAVEVRGTMKLSIGGKPMQEQSHGKLIQVLEGVLLNTGLAGIRAKRSLEIMALLDQRGGVDMERLFVFANVD